jgi:hypothetical protein
MWMVPISAIVLSLLGALVMRAAAAALGVPARIVIGIGPRIAAGDREPGAIELRPIPLWVSTHLRGGATDRWRRVIARASSPIAIVLVPFSLAVLLTMIRGTFVPRVGPPLVVGEVIDGTPASVAGIAPGDTILAVDGRPIDDLESLIASVADKAGTPTRVSLRRAGDALEVVVVPFESHGRAMIGIGRAVERRTPGPFAAIASTADTILHAWSLLLPEERPTSLIGPVGMVRESARSPRPDGATIALAIAASWASVAPLYALFAAIGQVVQARRSRRETKE